MLSLMAHKWHWTIAALLVFLMLVLSLVALVLVFPANTTAQCEPQLTVQNVLTQDAGGTEQTAFAPGETIRFVAEVHNGYGGYMLGANGTELAITTSFYSATNPVDIPPGVSAWAWEATTPSEAGDYAVEVRVYDHYCGISGGRGNSFTVGELEATPPPDDGGGTDLTANAGPDQTVPGPSPVAVQFDGPGSTGDIVSYQWYNQYGRTFTLVVEDSQGNTAEDQVTITLGETPEEAPTPTPSPTPTTFDLSITGTASPDPVLVGQNLTYTLTVTNKGPNSATRVTLTDSLPATTTYQSHTAPADWSCTAPAVGSTGTVTCNVESLAWKASAQIAIVVKPIIRGTITNTAHRSKGRNHNFRAGKSTLD
jgi:uncharacterized repeat protein (TIGR01451 family)